MCDKNAEYYLKAVKSFIDMHNGSYNDEEEMDEDVAKYLFENNTDEEYGILKELNDSRNYNDIHIEDIEDAICFLGRNNKYGEVYVSDSVKIIRSVYEEIQFKILFDKKDIIETCELDEMLYFLMNNKKFQIEMDDFDFSEVMGFIKTIYDCSLDDRIKVTFESDMSDIKDNIIYYNKG